MRFAGGGRSEVGVGRAHSICVEGERPGHRRETGSKKPGGLATGQSRAEEPAFLFPCHQAGGSLWDAATSGTQEDPATVGEGQDRMSGAGRHCQWPEALVGRPDVAACEQDGTGRASLPESSGKLGKS